MKPPGKFLKKTEIAHLMRAAASITNQKSFVMIGTGAAIVQIKHLPLTLMQTREIDIYADNATDPDAIADLIDGTIGEGSQFDQTFGYYAHGVGENTARLPQDWRVRAITVALRGIQGVTCTCPEINDIAVSKLCAGREKDFCWIRAAYAAGLVDIQIIRQRMTLVADLSIPDIASNLRRLGLEER